MSTASAHCRQAKSPNRILNQHLHRVPIINAPVAASTAEFSLRRFAWSVAGPRDFVINLLINGTIAWFVFGGTESVPLSGPDSIFKMLIPMSTIESILTSFFGVLNGTNELRKRAGSQSTIAWGRWVLGAISYSVMQGLFGFCGAWLARFLVGATLGSTPVSHVQATVLVGLISGILAYVLHSRAVIFSERLVSICTSHVREPINDSK